MVWVERNGHVQRLGSQFSGFIVMGEPTATKSTIDADTLSTRIAGRIGT